MNHWARNCLISCLTIWALAFGVTDAFAVNRVVLGNTMQTALAASTDEYTSNTLQTLRNQAAKKGSIRIIVGVRAAFAPEGEMSVTDIAQQRHDIADMHAAVLKKIPSLKSKPEKVRKFSTIPFMALEVDAAELEALAGQAEVTSIEEDSLMLPTLADSVPLIGGTAAWSSGYTGAGQAIAILDTGVDNTHPFLAGKVVAEACYSTNDSAAGASSLCPGGVTQSTATGSGVNCDTTISGCTHGTHVAGIAAGKGDSFSGVAKDASVIAIKVFTRFDNVTTCGSSAPCLSAYTADINLALEQVYLLKDTYSIAAVNMSLGGGGYSSQSSCDTARASTKSAIDNLRSVNIATVIASGNNGYNSYISAPGCISTAISVGATTKADAVASYSNSASFLNLLAPGSYINSSIPGGTYAVYSGTSMATPHVAGAWALLKQQKSNLSVTEALNLLTSTGMLITDSKNNIAKPRIQVDAALNVASGVAPTLTYSSEASYGTTGVSPSSGTTSTLFTYKIVYTDSSNIAPTSIRTCIDGLCNTMSKDTGVANSASRDGNYMNGEQYVYTTTLTAGTHNYYFNAVRGTTSVSLPATGNLSGPTVSDLSITTATLADALVGQSYSATIKLSGGIAPYSYSAPGLPTGLVIDSATGYISGVPTTVGTYGFSVSVTDATGATVTKLLSIKVISGAEISLSATTLAFGNQSVGTTSSAQSITVTNTGIATLSITSITVSGNFSISQNCAATLSAGSTCNIDVAFTPTVGGSRLGELLIASNAASGNKTVNLTGYGVTSAGTVTPMLAAGGYHTVALHSDGTVLAWGYNVAGGLGDGTTTQRNSPIVVPGISGIVAVSAGVNNTLALKSDGAVLAWGYNSSGQLGDGTTITRLSPVAVSGISGVVTLDAGANHSVAVKSDGTVMAWGFNANGQLGDGTTTNRLSPTAVPGLSGVVAVAAGSIHTVALKSDGTVMAWGYNGYGQLGDGTTTNHSSPAAVAGLTGVVAIAAGNNYSVALKSDGTVVAWGDNTNGQLGDGTTTRRLTPTAVLGLSGVVALASGTNYMVVLKSDGTVLGWGYNAYGQLGDGTTIQRLTPVAVPGVNSIVGIATNYQHTVALKSDGTVLAWGYNTYGQLGLGSAAASVYSPTSTVGVGGVGLLNLLPLDSVAPTIPSGLTASVVSTTQINLSWAFSTDNVGVTNYKVYRNGIQVGTPIATSYSDTGLTSATTYSYIVAACDAANNCSAPSAATSATTLDNVAPTIPTDLAASAVSATQINLSWTASTDNVAVTSYKIYRNDAQVGTATVTSFSDTGLTSATTYNYKVAACDAANNCSAQSTAVSAVTTDDVVPTVPTGLAASAVSATQIDLSWAASTDNVGVTGYKVYRNGIQVGTSIATSYSDTDLTSATTYSYTVAACDAANNCSAQSMVVTGTTLAALFPDGVVAWGINSAGQTTVPVGLSGVVMLAAGSNHTAALKSDGTVVAWGLNSLGQATVPAGLSGVAAIAAGAYHTVALKSDGTVVAWGYNVYGQSTVPADLSGVAAIAAGSYHTVALKSDGTMVAWGDNSFGQITIPAGLSGVVAVAAGESYTVALKKDGTVVAWGDNRTGQTTVPAGLSGVVAVAAGSYHIVALKSDGTVVAWGNDVNGQATVPVGLSGVVAVAAGAQHSVALKSDGTVVAWGNNVYGQTTVPAGLSGVVAIEAGDLYTEALVSTMIDNISPTVPTSLIASAFSATQINLSWAVSTDNIWVKMYKIYRNGVQVGTSILTSFADTGLTSATTYSYTVAACDAANNCSALSTTSSATTMAVVDLLMTAVATQTNNVQLGKQMTVGNTIKNQGAQVTTASTKVGIYLSKLATVVSVDTLINNSILIGSRTVTSLAAGATSAANTTVTIPNMPTGTYYLWAVADKDKSQPEVNETNNALKATGTIMVKP